MQSVFTVLKSDKLCYVMQPHVAMVHKLWCAKRVVNLCYYAIQISGSMFLTVVSVEQVVP
jgi:hypothetical protein